MKKFKKLALSLVAVAACAGAFGTYESYQQSGESNALLAENVEALSNHESCGGYTRSTGPCYKKPCDWKWWVSCASGGSQECYPSDCC